MSQCSLCNSTEELTQYQVQPEKADNEITLCGNCHGQIQNPDTVDKNHWHCLNESMWSENPAVQVMAWRMLKQLSSESWANDLLEQLYLDEENLAWAQAGLAKTDGVITKDSNGAILNAGDSVTIIKDLEVKGAGFTAKRGTLVKNIRHIDDPENIEGKVNGTLIVLKTKFLKKV